MRNIPLSLALGTGAVIAMYLLANVAYLVTLPFSGIQHAPSDRVATAMLQVIFPGKGAILMAVFIMISTFGCINGLILAGARASYAMARDKLFFRRAHSLNAARVPAWALVLQGVWSAFLVLPRTYDVENRSYGNLYSNLLDYVISAALDFLHPDGRRHFPAARDASPCGAPLPRLRLSRDPGAIHSGRGGRAGDSVYLQAFQHVARIGHRADRRAGVLAIPPGPLNYAAPSNRT